MTKTERQKKYKQIAELAEWVNEHRSEVAVDGMSIIMGIADEEKIRRLCLTGQALPLYTMLEKLRGAMADALEDSFSAEKVN